LLHTRPGQEIAANGASAESIVDLRAAIRAVVTENLPAAGAPPCTNVVDASAPVTLKSLMHKTVSGFLTPYTMIISLRSGNHNC
jgi:hypothetical protein